MTIKEGLLGGASALYSSSPPNDGAKITYLAQRFSFAARSEVTELLTEFTTLVDLPRSSLDELASQDMHRYQIADVKGLFPWITKKEGEDGLGREIRRFFAAQVMFDLLPNRQDDKQSYPKEVSDIFRDAACGLYSIGLEQFKVLLDVANDIAQWAQEKGLRSIVIVESPLGNCVPCQVINAVCLGKKLCCTIEEWGCPRNDRSMSGNTVKKSARSYSSRPVVKKADCIVFVDDCLTGSRFMKMARELRKAVGKDRFLAVALSFQFSPKSRVKPFDKRDLSNLEDWNKSLDFALNVVKFPDLPVFEIDQDGLVYLQSALSWGDSDMIAGKRKINIVFNVIDYYEIITNELDQSNVRYFTAIENVLWNIDSRGKRSVFAPGLTKKIFSGMFKKISVKDLFDRIKRSAQHRFPDDYLGIRPDLSEASIRERTNWLQTCISDCAQPELDTLSAGCLSRAVTEIHQGGVDVHERRTHRDHSYGHYTVPWNNEIQRFSKALIEMIVESKLDENPEIKSSN